MAQELPDDDISLASIFKKACSLHDELESYQGSTNDEKFQVGNSHVEDLA